MKKILSFGLALLLMGSVAFAGDYYGGSVTKSSLTADDSTNAVDMRGYSKLASHLVFATCTGAAADTAIVYLQTSNDGSNWTSILTVADDSGAGLSGNAYFDYLPDGATANQGGFGRYVRLYTDETAGTVNISYTWYFEAKE